MGCLYEQEGFFITSHGSVQAMARLITKSHVLALSRVRSSCLSRLLLLTKRTVRWLQSSMSHIWVYASLIVIRSGLTSKPLSHSWKPLISCIQRETKPSTLRVSRVSTWVHWIPEADWEMLDTCFMTKHFVESPSGELFFVKWYVFSYSFLSESVFLTQDREIKLCFLSGAGTANAST